MWSRVLEAVKRDGFDLKFIEVAGPDHVVPTRVYEQFGWDFDIYRTILSNAGREFDLLQPRGQLERMRGYGFWEDVIDFTKATNPITDNTNSEHEIAEERAIDRKSRFTLLLPPSTVGATEQPHESRWTSLATKSTKTHANKHMYQRMIASRTRTKN